MSKWWHPGPRVYYHIYQLEPAYERLPYTAAGTPEGERVAIEHTEWLAKVAFGLGRKAVYVLVKVHEFDVQGHIALRHEAILTSWNEPVNEPVYESGTDYPQVPLQDLRYELLSPPDEIEDDIDQLLESLIDWDGFALPASTA
jgi:hypothetical protein